MAAGGAFKVLGDAVNCVAPLAIALIVTYVTDVQAGTVVRSGAVVGKVSQRRTGPEWGARGGAGVLTGCSLICSIVFQHRFIDLPSYLTTHSIR